MALPKAVGYMIVLLVVCYGLENQGYRKSLKVFFEEWMGTKPSNNNAREKRAITSNSSEYVLQAVMTLSDLDSLRLFLDTLSLPLLINSTAEITSINTTTVCSSNVTGYQCRCEESFAWSYNSCINHGACDAIIGDTCGCINDLPADDQYCRLNTSRAVTPTPSPSPTSSLDPVKMDLVLDLRIPVSSVPSNFIDILRNTSYIFPHNITQSLTVISLNLTTVCYPNSTGGLQCQCEEQFGWSCDKCNTYGTCSNTTTQTCDCINSVPSDGQFCESLTSITPCPTPSTVTPTPSPSPTSSLDPVKMDLVLDLRIPVSSVPSNFIDILRNTSYIFPHNITQSLTVISLNLTTVCYPNSTGGLQCQCEEQFGWSCDKCNTYGTCSNTTTQTCDCINSVPSDGQFCESLTSITPCPTPSTAITTTPAMTTTQPMTTTPPMTTTTQMTTTTMPVSMTTTPVMTTAPMTTPMTMTTPMMTTTMPVNTTTTLMTTTPMTTTTTPVNTTTPLMTTTTPMTTTTTAKNTTTPLMTTTTPMTTTTTAKNTTTPLMTTTTPMTTTTMAVNTTKMPVTQTTMPEKTTTTPMMTTTKQMTTTTTKQMTTTTTTTTTTTEVRQLSLTMDMDFNDEFNNEENEVYIDTNQAIQEQCMKFITNLISATIIRFRAGSTIAEYSVRAPAFNNAEIEDVKTGIFADLGEKYPMIYESTESLTFSSSEVFSGESVTLTCGPPPPNLNLGSDWIAEWRRDNNLIRSDDEHSFSNNNGQATLTVSKSFATDNGRYECKLKKGNLAFRQKSKGTFTVKETPVIQVKPIRRKVKCKVDDKVSLQCSVQSPYKVKFQDTPDTGSRRNITHNFTIPDCENLDRTFICQVENYPQFNKNIKLDLSTGNFDCSDDEFGAGNDGDTSEVPCGQDRVGEKTAVCRKNEGQWVEQQDTCILLPVQQLFEQSESLNNNSLPGFLEQLSNVTSVFTAEVVESPNDINAIVDILNNVATLTSSSHITITKDLMEDVLLTAGVLTTDEAKRSWDNLNTNTPTTTSTVRRSNSSEAQSASSTFLFSIETITKALANDSFDIVTPSILLNKTAVTGTFNADFNSSVVVDIPDGGSNNITVITFASMDNVLPARDENNSTFNVINGRVVLLQSGDTINNVSFTFDIINKTIGNPQCVFWNFSLFNGLGGWDNEGCELVSDGNETVTCNCNHLTSFSMLMSPSIPKDPVLDFISFIGVGISMGSLVICLIIEAVIWRKIRRNNTSYLRHVSIVNIAMSLLIANIWFIIGAAISDAKEENPPACNAATFFIHVFYLSLFFWMLASGLLLLYRTVSVFDDGLTRKSMLAIGFSLGYGAPLIIATITIAVTAPKEAYIRGTGVCWLNWDESKALLAFVIPALLIVLINLMILLVVIYKMLRRRAISAQADERHVLVVIARSLAVLTPFFGLTWGLGVGTMTNPNNKGIHISFAFFNSLQGFFILVFGTLLDKKVRSEIAIKSQFSSGTSGTKTTSAGISSSSGLGFFRNWKKGKDGYNTSSNASGASQSFINT
ncbi:adhesion G protein-coupled receptor F5-like isoform X2 [Thunnus maccoyii]|uniref:adhesion G protein-coupled receptor F5-like isoform X2 n=1 Tax=Thunnus maccoyii TaxID=8240 RepID=UPI001C4BA287|nr:adhesion G protein-coupled receptor F5-like isoform X2 [Thunnus maccoyii]